MRQFHIKAMITQSVICEAEEVEWEHSGNSEIIAGDSYHLLVFMLCTITSL